MKEIILIRHATAEDRIESEDILRTLTENGRTESEDIGLLLSRLRKKVDLIITSNAKRALETADSIQTVSYSKVERKIEQTLYSGNMDDYLNILKQLNEKYNSVVLVAHNPVLRELAAYFLNESISNIVFPKASIYSFRVDCDTWKSINSNYSKLSLFIKKNDIEIITKEFINKKKLKILEKQYDDSISLINSIKKDGVKTRLTHDLRIVHRKWDSILKFASIQNSKLNNTIDTILASTGKYRDLCVQTEILKKNDTNLNIFTDWKKKKENSKKILSGNIEKIFDKNVKTLYKRIFKELAEKTDYFSEDVMKEDILKSLKELKIKEIYIKNINRKELHEFRLKVKSARYKIEFYNEIYQEYDYGINKLIFLQKKLGKSRDFQKLIKILEHKKQLYNKKETKNTIKNIRYDLQKNWDMLVDFFEQNEEFYINTGG